MKYLEALEDLFQNTSPFVDVEKIDMYHMGCCYDSILEIINALNIIVKKDIKIYWVRKATNLSEYNYFVADLYSNDIYEDLSEDEFEFIKGVVSCFYEY